MSVYGNPVWIPRIAQRQPYLEFSADGEFGICASEKYWDGSLYYSTDKTTWDEWDSATIYSDNGKLYLRGTGNTIITGQPSEYPQLRNFELELYTGTSIECSGSIETLLDWETYVSGNHPTMGAYAFASLFKNCTVLSKAPELTPVTLTDYCYSSMFESCELLTAAPVLPATTLAEGCYEVMFSRCCGLLAAPELPAATLADYCYLDMFAGCAALAAAPALPALTMAEGCYEDMFCDCTSLVSVPDLPALTLADFCYEYMFGGCTSLTTPPTISAMTLAKECCSLMFCDCVRLSAAPALPAATLAEQCYANMFEGCIALTAALALPATSLAKRCYSQMFKDCTSLVTPPELPATTLPVLCYESMFRGCSSLMISETQGGAYLYPYRIPESGTGSGASDALSGMFWDTGGTVPMTPTINTTYYTDHEPVAGAGEKQERMNGVRGKTREEPGILTEQTEAKHE